MDGNNQQFEQQINPQGRPQYYQQAPGQAFDPFAIPNYSQGYPYVQQPAPFDKKAAKKHFSRVGMGYFLFAVAATAAQVVVSVAVGFINPDLWDNYLFSMLAALLPMYLIGAPVCWLVVKNIPAEKPERGPWGFGRFIVGLIISLGLMYIGSFIGTYIGLLIESFAPDATASTNVVQEMVFSGNMIVNIVFMVFVGPIVEELLFRKLLCDRLRIYGEGVTVIVTGLLFGLFHGNLTQFVYAFLLGCVLAYIYLKTGRVTVTIAYHIVINFIGSVVPLLALSATDLDGIDEILSSGDSDLVVQYVLDNPESFAVYALYSLGIFGVMIAGLLILIILAACGKIKFRPGRITIPKGMRFGVIIVNVGMILFILAEMAEILINMFA